MAPGTSKQTLTINGFSRTVEILSREAGPATGDTRLVARDEQGNRMILLGDSSVTSLPTDPSTGDQWGTLG